MIIPMEVKTEVDARDFVSTIETLRSRAAMKRNDAIQLQKQIDTLTAEARGLEEGADLLELRVERLVRTALVGNNEQQPAA